MAHIKRSLFILAAIPWLVSPADPGMSAAPEKPSAVITGKLLSAEGDVPAKNIRLALCTYAESPNQAGALPGQKVPVVEKTGGPLVGVFWVGSRETISILQRNTKLPTAKSDASGVFSFKKVPLGKYVISLAEGRPCYSFVEADGAPVVVSIEAPDQVVDLGEVKIKGL